MAENAAFSFSTMKAIMSFIKDMVIPPTCLSCQHPIASDGGLCVNCWKALRPITKPLCTITGQPFAYELGEDTVSAEAIAHPPDFDRSRAAVAYNDFTVRLISRFKYYNQQHLAHIMTPMMINAGRDLISDTDLIIPTPLYRWRLWKRGYNQSAELAKSIAAATHLPIAWNSIIRVKNTKHQVSLSQAQRRRNLQGAFQVNLEQRHRLSGRSVLIIDDVFTTGATANSMARCLKRANVSTVNVLTFAKVIKEIT